VFSILKNLTPFAIDKRLAGFGARDRQGIIFVTVDHPEVIVTDMQVLCMN
jgi:hypothetical protein